MTAPPAAARSRASLRVAGAVLAAGGSTRMGQPKALLDAGGTTFLNRLASTLADGGCDPVLVVVPSADGPVAAEVAQGPGRAVVNPEGGGGQIGSLRVALDYLRELREPSGAVVFTPVDNPAATSETVRLLIDGWVRSDAAIVVPRFGSERGHPVLADMAVAPEFYRDDLAEGARGVVRRVAARVLEVPVLDPGTADDLDTPEEYRSRFPAPSPVGDDR